MSENRNPRDSESREKQQRYVYAPPNALPDPAPDDKFVYRWVATHVLGQLDPRNTSTRFREGWEPVKASDHPELHLQGNTNGNVEIGGLILCKMPRGMAEARERYFAEQARNQMESVDNHFLRNEDKRMPLFTDRTSEVTGGRARSFGTGTK